MLTVFTMNSWRNGFPEAGGLGLAILGR